MPLYLSRFSYTPETWARLIGHPEDRCEAVPSDIESVGAKLHGFCSASAHTTATTTNKGGTATSLPRISRRACHMPQIRWLSPAGTRSAC